MSTARPGKTITGTIVVLGLLCCLSACSMVQGREKDGIYSSPDGEFSVTEPKLPYLEVDDLLLTRGIWRVQFTEAGQWPSAGDYAVEWDQLDGVIGSDEDFYVDSTLILSEGIDKSLGAHFKLVRVNRLTIGGHAALQIITRGVKDALDSYCIATAINFHNRRAIGMLLIPIRNSAGSTASADPDQAIPWDKYNALLASIQDHTPGP